jgi:protein associated with RNAse G/E
VEAIGERWLVAYHPEPHHVTADGTDVAQCLRYYGMDCPLSVLVSFDALGNVLEYQCDASLPATIEGRQISFVDLDLDVMAGRDLKYYIRDEDTFAGHTKSMAYPPKVIAAARAGVALAIELIEARQLPFDGSAERLLGRVLAADGPL